MKLRHGAQAVVWWLNLFLLCRFLAQARLTKREKLANVSFTYVGVRQR